MKSKLLAVMIDRQQKTMRHIAQCLHSKKVVPLEQQADWLKSKPVEYYIGLADGVNNMLEDALHSSKEYKGFHHIYFPNNDYESEPTYVPHRSSRLSDQPEFQEWCRQYH